LIIDQIGNDNLTKYIENLPIDLRNDGANNRTLYVVLVDRLISNNSDAGIDTIKRLRPLSLFPGQYSNLLTKAALEPTGSLAHRISKELIPHQKWPLLIDERLFQNLIDSGLGIKESVDRLESLPGGKDLAAAAVVRHYMVDENGVDFESSEGIKLLTYINLSDRMSLHSKALLKKLGNGEKLEINEHKFGAPAPHKDNRK
jgi:hypothetical protein